MSQLDLSLSSAALAQSIEQLVHEADRLMQQLTLSEHDFLGSLTAEQFKTGGKRLRARLAFMSLEAFHGIPAHGTAWAAACELLHHATLIHDDIQDGDCERRGFATMWLKHGLPQAINAGDLLLMLPFRALAYLPVEAHLKWQLTQCLAAAAENMVRGQARELCLLELDNSSHLRSEYVCVARGKTAALFQMPVEGSALLAGLPPEQAQRYAREFATLGIVFQIVDDLLDFFGKKGKALPGEDLREGKVTCLVIEHLERRPSDRDELFDFLRLSRDETPFHSVQKWLGLFEQSGAVTSALQAVRSLAMQFSSSPILESRPQLKQTGQALLERILAPIQQEIQHVPT